MDDFTAIGTTALTEFKTELLIVLGAVIALSLGYVIYKFFHRKIKGSVR